MIQVCAIVSKRYNSKILITLVKNKLGFSIILIKWKIFRNVVHFDRLAS